jgi:ATP/maltotriose-dependent transcriptional regulator MalT
MTLAERLQRVDDVRDIQAVLTERDLIQDNPERALSRLRPLLVAPGWEQHLNLLLAVAATNLATGDLMAAEDAATRAVAEMVRQRLPVGTVDALRIQGTIACRRGDLEAAVEPLQVALQMARNITYPWGEARALYESGLMCATRGDTRLAREQLGLASAMFEHLGAEPYRLRADRAAEQYRP